MAARIKLQTLVLIFFSSVLIISCAASKVQYQLPDAMLPHVKVEYALRCEKGERLYAINCARCHDLKKGNKTLTPDFTENQLQGYSIRVANALHETNMPDTLVSEEELVLISTFLSYKKKSGIPAIKKK